MGVGPHTAQAEVNKKCFLNGLSQSVPHRRTFPGKMRKRQQILIRLMKRQKAELSLDPEAFSQYERFGENVGNPAALVAEEFLTLSK